MEEKKKKKANYNPLTCVASPQVKMFYRRQQRWRRPMSDNVVKSIASIAVLKAVGREQQCEYDEK